MKVEDIVEGLNRHIEEIRRELGLEIKGHIVLHRTIEPCSIKAYKKYKAELFYVDKSKSMQYVICGAIIQDRVIEGQEDKINKELNTLLIKAVLDFSKSELYNKVIEGLWKE